MWKPHMLIRMSKRIHGIFMQRHDDSRAVTAIEMETFIDAPCEQDDWRTTCDNRINRA